MVVNPSNLNDTAALRARISQICAQLEWAPPLWLETTVEDPGCGQARTARSAGANVVVVCGGDGTVRHVAEVLAGSGIAMGLLPTGTGNLLARNMRMAIGDLTRATRIALCGDNRAIDVGRVLIDNRDEEHVFLVMAGVGFDAAVMAGAPHDLKSRLGPRRISPPDFVHCLPPRAGITLTVDGRTEPCRPVRTIVVGNCGRLLGGLVLLPAARVDDELLDVESIGLRASVAG